MNGLPEIGDSSGEMRGFFASLRMTREAGCGWAIHRGFIAMSGV
jgi:hypothetical protein